MKGGDVLAKINPSDTKNRLVAAAIDIIYEIGFQKTRVSDIVKTAQVAQGTFYLYFKSKEDVFLQICHEFKTLFSTLIEGSEELFSGSSYREVEKSLFGFIRDLVRLYTDNKKMARIIFNETGISGPLGGEMGKQIYSDFIDITRRRLEQSRNFGYINFEDAETEAAFLVGLLSRSLFYFIEMKNDIDSEALSRRMTMFILGGLGKISGGSDPGKMGG